MKILIIHASAGAGHTKAAEALYGGIKGHAGVDVVIIDALDYTNPFNKFLYQKTYSLLVTRVPLLWGWFFSLTDLPALRPTVRLLRRFFNGLVCGSLVNFLKKEQFDFILSTHFLSNEVTAYLKRRGDIKAKVIAVITDFDVHSIWLREGIDVYAVACDTTKEKLVKLGVKEEKIAVTGIPVHAKFLQIEDKVVLKEKLGVKPGVFTVLLATGSFGMGPIAELVADLSECQVLVVCGHNTRLYNILQDKAMPGVKVFGLVDNMQELMSVADVMITKPGGLSIAEALVKDLPLIFFSAIPGQETNNVNVLQKYGIGINGQNIAQIVVELRRLSTSYDEFRAVRKNIARLAKPQAVELIKTLIR